MARKWTDKEIQFLKDNYKTLSLEKQSKILKRSVSSIMTKAERIGLKRGRYWTKEQKSILLNNLDKTYKELAKIIPEKTYSEIRSYCQNNKIKTGSYQEEWSEEEENILLSNSYDKTLEDIYKLLPNRSKDAIRGKMQIMGISIKTDKCWTPYEIDFLKNNLNNKSIYEISKILNRSERAIHKKISKLKLNYQRENTVYYNNLSEVFSDYKKLLKGEIDKFKKQYDLHYDIILFKYYLKKNNISPTKEWVYNIHFTNFLKECKLWNRVKKKWHSSFEFISACFPQYNLKEYNFKTLQVREGFWLKDYNCYDNIREGINKLYADNMIENDAQILNLDLNTTYKYFHKTMIYYRGFEIFFQYLEFHNITYDKQVYYDGIRFDSMEEMSVYKFIKLNINNTIQKYKGALFYNDIHKEGYYPDFILSFNNKKIIIEYFGMYKDPLKLHSSVIEEYINKTHRKIKYFNNIKGYEFVDLYPEDIKNDFEGVRNKLTPFIMQKKGSDIDESGI